LLKNFLILNHNNVTKGFPNKIFLNQISRNRYRWTIWRIWQIYEFFVESAKTSNRNQTSKLFLNWKLNKVSFFVVKVKRKFLERFSSFYSHQWDECLLVPKLFMYGQGKLAGVGWLKQPLLFNWFPDCRKVYWCFRTWRIKLFNTEKVVW